MSKSQKFHRGCASMSKMEKSNNSVKTISLKKMAAAIAIYPMRCWDLRRQRWWKRPKMRLKLLSTEIQKWKSRDRKKRRPDWACPRWGENLGFTMEKTWIWPSMRTLPLTNYGYRNAHPPHVYLPSLHRSQCITHSDPHAPTITVGTVINQQDSPSFLNGLTNITRQFRLFMFRVEWGKMGHQG